MEFINREVLKNQIILNRDYTLMVHKMADEVKAFYQDFADEPSHQSEWGHHYFCENDGGRLIYDRKKPRAHRCEICGQVYDTQLLYGVWRYMYRNEAIMTVWKAAILYRINEEPLYLEIVRTISTYYAKAYLSFQIHDKFGLVFDEISQAVWGCGRIMPQGLNESIFMIKLINGLELVKEEMDAEWFAAIRAMFIEAFELIAPQLDRIHNISCWNNCSIGAMGLFLNDSEMIDFAFEGAYNIRRQLEEGVTSDGFWYEGSIHYNFFTLEGVTNLLMLTKTYGYDFGEAALIVEKMFVRAYEFAFDNHQLPNPNDGWPNINLRTYDYIYSMGVKVFGIDSRIGQILSNILNKDTIRGLLPLSRPYYYNNTLALERLLFIPELDLKQAEETHIDSRLFPDSCTLMLRNNQVNASSINIFCKYGHNGPSHAHPDKMNIEVVIGGMSLSRDLSNSGYGNVLCDEWHRQSVSHNTVVVNGKSHTSVERGKCIDFDRYHAQVEAKHVYSGIHFQRDIKIQPDGFIDNFTVEADELNHYDYFFHIEAELITKPALSKASLAYETEGYQHIMEIQRVTALDPSIVLEWQLGEMVISSEIDLEGKSLFLAKTPDNPVNKSRTTLILGTDGNCVNYKIKWKIKR